MKAFSERQNAGGSCRSCQVVTDYGNQLFGDGFDGFSRTPWEAVLTSTTAPRYLSGEAMMYQDLFVYGVRLFRAHKRSVMLVRLVFGE